MGLLFLHGAGGYADDGPLADALGRALGTAVDRPRLPGDDMSYEAWAVPVREHLGMLGPDGLVVGHSLGGSILLRVLAEGVRPGTRAALLAVPDWGPDGWDVADYAFSGPEPRASLTLHHCRDDEVVPFAHLAQLAARLPSARVVEHAVGGHQLDGLAGEVARSLDDEVVGAADGRG